MEYDRNYLRLLRRKKEGKEVTPKAIIGIVGVVIVVGGLVIMFIRNRRKR